LWYTPVNDQMPCLRVSVFEDTAGPNQDLEV
jgi:hypothetical protein